MTADQIYNDISAYSVVNYNDSWSEEDLRDASRATFRHWEKELGEETDA